MYQSYILHSVRDTCIIPVTYKASDTCFPFSVCDTCIIPISYIVSVTCIIPKAYILSVTHASFL